MASIKRFIFFCGAALSLVSTPHNLSAQTYEGGSNYGSAYEGSRSAPNVSPGLALGVVATAGIIALIVTTTNNNNHHHHISHSHS